MNRKQIAILLVLAIIIGGVGFFLQRRSQSEWAESAAPSNAKVLDFPINDVARLVVRTSKGEVHLAKKNDIWTVQERDDYPANFQQVSGLIRQLWELRAVQDVNAGQAQFAQLELVEPGQGEKVGTLVELADKNGKNLTKIIAGKRNFRKNEGGPLPFATIPAGRYMLSPQSGKVSLVNQFMEIDSKPESWLKHDFIKIDNLESITLGGQTAPRHWSVMRSDLKADWKLADAKANEELDKPTLGTIIGLLTAPTFVDVLPADAKPQEHGLDKPDVLTTPTFDRFTYTLKIGKLSGENYPVTFSVNADPLKERTPAPDEKPEDKAKLDEEFKKNRKELEEKATNEKECEKRIYLVSKSFVDPLLKDRADLLKKAKPSPLPTATPRRRK